MTTEEDWDPDAAPNREKILAAQQKLKARKAEKPRRPKLS